VVGARYPKISRLPLVSVFRHLIQHVAVAPVDDSFTDLQVVPSLFIVKRRSTERIFLRRGWCESLVAVVGGFNFVTFALLAPGATAATETKASAPAGVGRVVGSEGRHEFCCD